MTAALDYVLHREIQGGDGESADSVLDKKREAGSR
jgi:hypothetical protein